MAQALPLRPPRVFTGKGLSGIGSLFSGILFPDQQTFQARSGRAPGVGVGITGSGASSCLRTRVGHGLRESGASEGGMGTGPNPAAGTVMRVHQGGP